MWNFEDGVNYKVFCADNNDYDKVTNRSVVKALLGSPAYTSVGMSAARALAMWFFFLDRHFFSIHFFLWRRKLSLIDLVFLLSSFAVFIQQNLVQLETINGLVSVSSKAGLLNIFTTTISLFTLLKNILVASPK